MTNTTPTTPSNYSMFYYESMKRVFMCRWDDNIKMALKEIGCEDVDWTQ
jgi:hypothetical protein